MTRRLLRPRLGAPRAVLLLAALAAMGAPGALSPGAALAEVPQASRGLPGGAAGVTVRRGGEAQPAPPPSDTAPSDAAPAQPGPGATAGGRMFDLESVAPCVLAAKPDMSQAILCYGPMIETCAGRDGREAHLACQRRAEGEWAALAERYGDQPMTRRLASAFDPAACERLSSPGLPLDEGRLQCRITALLSRALYGHIESLWGGLGPGLRP